MSGSGMELTARAFDLMGALVRAAEPVNTMAKWAQDLTKWLAREKVDETMFAICAEKAKGLAYPNRYGMELQTAIQAADQRLNLLKNAPLNLVVSGSLGRMMASDPEFSYIVSTCVALANFYGAEEVAHHMCLMILQYVNLDVTMTATRLYEPQLPPIKAVISKIVESVFINVVNAGHQMGGLPSELRHLHAHLAGEMTLSPIIMAIQQREGDIVIVSDHFLADITTWLYYHFDGFLEISVGTDLLLSKCLGQSSRRIGIVVRKRCDDEKICYKHTQEGLIEVSEAASDGSFKTFINCADSVGDKMSIPRSRYRRPLYSDDHYVDFSKGFDKATSLKRAERHHAFAVAKRIISWLFALPINISKLYNFIVFEVGLDGVDRQMKLRDLLFAHPSLLNQSTGHLESSSPTFRAIPDVAWPSSRNPDSADALLAIDGIMSCFPLAVDFLDEVKKRCECSSCESGAPLSDAKPGCLRYVGVTELFGMMAEAIAESLGAKDISGLAQAEGASLSMQRLLFNLLRNELLFWNDLVLVFACTAAGLSWESLSSRDMPGRVTHGCKHIVAVQNGCYTAIATWASLERLQKIQGCFHLEVFEGNIKGIAEDVAVLGCETTQHCDQSEQLRPLSKFEDAVKTDITEVSTTTAIFRLGPSIYRLLTFVNSPRCRRIIDPGNVVCGIALAMIARCPHRVEGSDPTSAFKKDAFTYTFEDVLCEWGPDHLTRGPKSVYLTQVLCGDLKLNTAIALCMEKFFLHDGVSSCWPCAVQFALESKDIHGRHVVQYSGLNRKALLN